MYENSAQAFRFAAETYRLARESVVAVMRQCQAENLRLGARADEIASQYQISLQSAEALTRPGPLPRFDDPSLHGGVLLAQYACDLLMHDRGGACEVLRVDIVSIDSVSIVCGSEIDSQFLSLWSERARQLGFELHWQVTPFSSGDVASLGSRLAAGEAGARLGVVRTTIEGEPTPHARFVVEGSAHDIARWTRSVSWPSWAELEPHSQAGPTSL